ncbi:hypothetical protein Fmac_018900 [Flemingia macrophylla]|uniref:rRNA methyltransferase 2, mitochondrial n=1 Tax=Flemingia macrophylla TaxID=520843 RepID=A0ABD1M6A2_9FABA
MGVGGTADFFYKEAQRLGYVARPSNWFRYRSKARDSSLPPPPSSTLAAPRRAQPGRLPSLSPIAAGGSVLGVDTKKIKPPPFHCDSRVQTLSADVTTLPRRRLRALSPTEKGFSVVLSDMCPSVSGITTKDAALSFELAMRALDLALGDRIHGPGADDDDDGGGGLLRVGGHLVVKLLESEDAKCASFFLIPFFADGGLGGHVGDTHGQNSITSSNVGHAMMMWACDGNGVNMVAFKDAMVTLEAKEKTKMEAKKLT